MAAAMFPPALAQTAETATAAGMRESLRLLDLPATWVLVLVILPLAALVCWLGYRGERLSPLSRGVLFSLRFGALLVLLLVLFRPVLVLHREEVQKAEVIVLVDDSASMQRKDAYSGDAAMRQALEKLSNRELADTQRGELARAALERGVLPMLEQQGYEVRLFGFADAVVPLTGLDDLSSRGSATHVGGALAQALAAHRGRHVTDVLILSDGKSNGGNPASEAARTAASLGIAVHTVVIGDTRPERNAVIELVEAPTNVLEGDEIAVTVRVLGRGTDSADASGREGARTQVLLEEYEPLSREEGMRRVVAEKEARLTETGERVTLVARPGPADARTGDRRFRVQLPPLEGETLLDDNALEFSVHVTREKVRVLYVDGYPRWEYRYLKNLLLRSDENLEVQCYLLSATPDFPQESTKGLAPLAAVPTSRRALLDNYDVIILGDVNPYAVSPNPAQADEFVGNVREFVVRGGGLLFIAGEYDNPRAYVRTPLEELFPIFIDTAEMAAYRGDTTLEFRPRIADPLNPHEIVRLHPDPSTNRRLWQDEGGLRGMYWFAPVSRAKPGSQVLLHHPTQSNRYGDYPLLVSGYFPSGRTLFVAFDATWMWRYHFGDTYHERFWRNAIRWLSLGRLRSGDRRYRVETARNAYSLGERVAVEARVLNEDYRPSDQSSQKVRWSDPEGKTRDLELPAVQDRPGLYRGAIDAERPGLHRVWIEVDGARITSAEFEAVLPSLENQDPAPDPLLLREVSAISKGKALDLSQIAQLGSEFPGGEERREPISSRLDDVWDAWGTLLLALGLLSAEWVLRKRLELV
jgi:hypothetical protein